MSNDESKVAVLVNQLPETDAPGKESTFTGPDPEQAKKIAAGILEGGRDAVLELAGMIRDGQGNGAENYKPGYALHCVALHAGAPGQEESRALFAGAVAAAILGGNQPKEARAFLIRELQVVGGAEANEPLGRLLKDEDLCEYAALALTAIGGAAAAARLREALPVAKGRSRAAIVQALGRARDAASSAAFRAALGDPDREVRLAAAWALARIADIDGAGAVLQAADKAEGWERIQLAKACLLLAENLLQAGNSSAARRIYNHLRKTRAESSERHLVEAAERGLARIVD